MTPQSLDLILQLLEVAIKEAPAVEAEVKEFFSKPNPTPADWMELRKKALAKSYADYVPDSALTEASPKA